MACHLIGHAIIFYIHYKYMFHFINIKRLIFHNLQNLPDLIIMRIFVPYKNLHTCQ